MLSLKIAVRFLRSGRGQTILIIIGIGIAISAQIFIGLLITSLQRTIINRTIGHSPQITISSAINTVYIKDWQTIVYNIQQTGLVNTIAVTASGNGFIERNKKTTPVLVRGMDAQAFNDIYGINTFIYSGNWTPSGSGGLAGRDLADSLGYKLGDNLVVNTPDGGTGTYKILGFFDSGVSGINKTWVITSLSSAQALFGYDKYVTSIEMNTNDLFQADNIAGRLKPELNNNNITIENWKSENQQLLSGLQGQSTSSLMIQIFIILSVVIAIASILAITVFQKSRQLGILKAMGIKDRDASLIFIFEGLIIGMIGSIIGVLLGLGLLYGFAFGTTKPGEVPLIDLYLDYQFVALSWGIAILSSILAAAIPARRSLRLNPIDVIREG
jgi:lipoprotein-releasing system permease protein